MDKFVQKIIALGLAAVMLFSSVYIDVSLLPQVEAAEGEVIVTPTLTDSSYIASAVVGSVKSVDFDAAASATSYGEIRVTTATELVDIARWSQTNDTSNTIITIVGGDVITLDDSFVGLGSEACPFTGTIKADAYSTDRYIQLNGSTALFGCLSASAHVFETGNPVQIQLNGAGSGLAQVLVAGTASRATVSNLIKIVGVQDAAANVTNNYELADYKNAGMLFGRVEATASDFTLRVNATVNGTACTVSAATGGSAGGLIGVIHAQNMRLELGENLDISGANVSAASGDAGGLVGRVSGSVTVAGTGAAASAIQIGTVTAHDGSAGGVAGCLADSSTLTMENNPFTVAGYDVGGKQIAAYSPPTAAANGAGGVVGVIPKGSSLITGSLTVQQVAVGGGAAAGGVVGKLCGELIATGSDVRTCVVSTAVGGNGCMGGYVGCWEPAETITLTSSTSVSGGVMYPMGSQTSHCGGLIGHVTASVTDFTISGATIDTTTTLSCKNTMLSAGGLVGTVENNKTNEFVVNGNTYVTSKSGHTTSRTIGACGGIIGTVAENSYALLNGVVANADYSNVLIERNETAPSSSAGGVGRVADGASLTAVNCHICHANSQTYDKGKVIFDEEEGDLGQCAVFIGETGAGSVVRLAGVLDLSAGGNKFGSVVRRQESSLIYASDSSLTIGRGTIAGDDIGSYGQIINNDAIGNIISFDETTHTASISSMSSNAVVSGSALTATITSLADYARLAIAMMSHGFFSAVEGADSTNYTSKLYGNVTLVLATDTNLTGSGIEGLTRSCGEQNSNAVITKLTVKGNGHTVTLDVGAYYGTDTDACRGLYLHNTTNGSSWQTYAGLVGRCGSLTANDVTVAGRITVNRSGTQTRNYVGGLCGLVNGTLNAGNCVSRVDIGACYNNSSLENYFGGFVGRCNKSPIDVTMTHCTSAATLTSQTTSKTPYMGGFIAQIDGSKGPVVLTDADTTGVTLEAKWTDSGSTSANIGGLVANITNQTGKSGDDDDKDKSYRIENQMPVTVSGRLGGSVTLETSKSGSVGGLLGYKWTGVNTVITNTDLGGVSTPTSINGRVIATGSNIGGLVHKMTGQMTIGAGTDIKGEFVCGYTANTDYNALVVREGKQLYMVVADGNAFGTMLASHSNIDRSLKVPESGPAGYFDLLVGRNIKDYSIDGAPQTGGIVTIETGDGLGKLPASGSDWYTFIDESGSYYNPNTRYYTNIAGLSDPASDTDVKLMRWHLNAYKNNIDYTSFGGAGKTDYTGDNANDVNDANMAGWCLYPTTVHAVTVNLQKHTLTFGLPEGERAVSAISYPSSQMYMAQTGLILDATAADGSHTVTVKNVVMTGTVNSWGHGSGALITGIVKGYYNEKSGKWTTETLNITNLELAGLKVASVTNATAYAPLLVNGIDTHVKSTIDSITYATGTNAATTLLGWAGAPSLASTEKGTDISVNFTKLALYDKEGVFTKGTLFHTVNCGINSYFTYNFTKADDGYPNYTHANVTYGSDTNQMVPEKEYIDEPTTVASRVIPTNPSFSFNDYLPYIYFKASDTDFTVNEKVGDLDEGDGWGTYAHPYHVTKGSQLMALLNMVNTGTVNPGWVIKYPDNVENPVAASTYTYNKNAVKDYEFEKTSGNSSADTVSLVEVRTWMEGAYYSVLASLDMSQESSFVGGIGTSGTNAGEHPFHGVIIGNGNTITMPTGSSSSGQMWGLIGTANGCVVKDLTVSYGGSLPYMANSLTKDKTSVTNDSYMGGVIARIIGGDNVLDKVKVDIGSETHFMPNNESGTPLKLSCVGGYVGLVETGGLLLRNMGASGLKRSNGELYGTQSAANVTPNNNYLYVNNYVGRVLDGYVIDQTGMEEEGVWRSGVDNTDSMNSYTDYAIIFNELTATSTNGGRIGFVSGTNSYDVTLSNGAELFVLASAVNSSDGYTTGATGSRQRWGNYDDVGNTSSASDLISDDLPAGVTYSGVAGNAYSYLGTRFAGGITISDMKLMTSKTVNITLDGDANVGGVGNYNTAFRGIGGQFTLAGDAQKSTPLLNLGTFGGGGHTVTLGMERRQYGTLSAAAPYTLSWDDTRHNGWDTGLFNRLACAATLTNVTVSGSVKMQVWSTDGERTVGFSSRYDKYKWDSSNKAYYNCAAAGGLAGSFSTPASGGTRTVSKVYLDGLTVTSAGMAGGIVGCEDDIFYNVSTKKTVARMTSVYTDCGYESITVAGGLAAGGLVGFGRFHEATMDNTATDTTLRDSEIRVARNGDKAADAFNTNFTSTIGAGGAVGVGVSMYNEATPIHTLTLQGMEAERLTVWTMAQTGGTACATGAGGLLGRVDGINLVANGCTVTDAYLFSGSGNGNKNDTADLGDFTRDWGAQSYVRYLLSRSNDNYNGGAAYLEGAAGGLLGGYGNNGNNNKSTAHTVVLQDCTVTTSSATATSLVAGFVVAGGLLGDLRISNKNSAPNVDELTVEDCRVNPGSGKMLLLGGTRAAGVVAYTKYDSGEPSVSIARTDVGSEGGATYVLATVASSDGIAAGLVGESQMNVTVDTATVTNAVLAGNNAGGVLGLGCETDKKQSHVIQISDASVRGCLLYGVCKDKKYYYSGGIVGTANTKATVALERCAVEECRVEVGNTGYRTGGFVGNVLAATTDDGLYANSLLWVNNVLSQSSSAATYASLLAHDIRGGGKGFGGRTADIVNGGLIAGSINSKSAPAEVLGVSRIDENVASPAPYKDVSSGSAKVLYVDYSRFVSGTNPASSTDDVTAAGILTSPKHSLRTASATQTSLTITGDAIGFVQASRTNINSSPTNTAVAQQGDSLWKEYWFKENVVSMTNLLSSYGEIVQTATADSNMPAASVTDAQAALASDTKLKTLPVLYLKNIADLNGVLTSFVNQLTRGGFAAWKDLGKVSGSSTIYTVQTDGRITTRTNAGSIVYDSVNKVFRSTDTFDRIKLGESSTFTVLTLQFTSNGETYNLALPLYYPQVMKMETHLRIMSGETYNVSMLQNEGAYQKEIATGDIFTLYLEYVFDQERMVDDWSFPKLLYSRDMFDCETAGTMIPVGTDITLISLGATARENEIYFYHVTTATNIIDLSEFHCTETNLLGSQTDVKIEMPNLASLTSLASLTTLTAQTGQTACATIATNTDRARDDWGAERYLLIVRMPELENMTAANDFYLMADVSNERNVDLTKLTEGTTEPRAKVAYWPKTIVTATNIEGGSSLSAGGFIRSSYSPKIGYPESYPGSGLYYNDVVRVNDRDASQYAVLRYQLVDSSGRVVPIPENTVITVRCGDMVKQFISNGESIFDYVISDGDTPRNMMATPLDATEAYEVTLDFSNMTAEELGEAFPEDGYQLTRSLSLTEDLSHPESGQTIQLPSVIVDKATSQSSSVAVNVVDDVRDLGVNYHDIEQADNTNYGYIDFQVDCLTTATASNFTWSLELSLEKKVQGTYTDIPYSQLGSYLMSLGQLATLSDCGRDAATAANIEFGTLTGNPTLNITEDMADGQATRWFRLKVNPNIAYFANYKLVATLICTGTNSPTVQPDHFIYTVAKVNTDPLR